MYPLPRHAVMCAGLTGPSPRILSASSAQPAPPSAVSARANWQGWRGGRPPKVPGTPPPGLRGLDAARLLPSHPSMGRHGKAQWAPVEAVTTSRRIRFQVSLFLFSFFPNPSQPTKPYLISTHWPTTNPPSFHPLLLSSLSPAGPPPLSLALRVVEACAGADLHCTSFHPSRSLGLRAFVQCLI